MKKLQVIGLTALMLGFATAHAEGDVAKSATPAERHHDRMQKGTTSEDMMQSPKTKSASRGFKSKDHEGAYKTLSPKNRAAFDALEEHQQEQVVDKYKRGKDHQKEVTKMLHEDQKKHDKKMDESSGHFWETHKNKNSPAERSMKRQQKKSSKDSIFG